MPRHKGGVLKSASKVDYSPVKDIMVPYRRVSTQEQAEKGVSLDWQGKFMDAHLELRGQTALTWDCVDKGKSGKNMNRDGLNEALSLVEQGKAGGIIVAKLDRLSRSLLDFAYLMARANSEGWNIVLLDLGVDLATPAGKAMAQMLAIFAEFERNVISQRTKDGLAEKRAQGVVLGRRRTVSDELLAAIVGMYQSDPNYSSVARWLNETGVETAHGGKQWYPAVVQKLVHSPAGQQMLELFEEAA